jgi:hypothetical protein
MASSALENLGRLHIVTGRIIYTGGVPALTTNDGSATVADTGANGNSTVTFGDAFLSAPQVTAQYLKATNSATVVHHVTVEQATTTTAEFWVHTVTDTGAGVTDLANADPADGDGIMFTAIGLRNN